jgi:hypothetical protein
MIGLALLLSGNGWGKPPTAAASSAVALALALFAANVLLNAKARLP